MLPKKKIVQLSKKKVDKALKEQKETLKEHSPLEKAKKAYHEAAEEKKTEDESSTDESTESSQDQKTPDPTPVPHTGDLSVMVDKSYDQIKRTTRGLSAAASSLFGQSFGTEKSTQSEKTDAHTSGSNEDAIALARKILERKKKEKIDR